MAGIGWKLQRMIDRGSLAGTIGAYLTGVAVTSAPWLLTTAVLTSLRLVARRSGTDFEVIERFLTVVYAVTVVLSAPVHVVVSRYTADRLYDHHVEKIGAPLRRATALTLLMFAVTGIVVVALMRLPLSLAVVGAPLCAIVGAQWLMLSVG
ncbi:MAG: exopolysaccharide Pel transporter PelG, partial [Haliangium ochraceum]